MKSIYQCMEVFEKGFKFSDGLLTYDDSQIQANQIIKTKQQIFNHHQMMSEQNCSLDIMNQEDSMCRNNEAEDPFQRAAKHLRNIIQENDKLQQEILTLRTNPKEFINPIKNQLVFKIRELQNQNSKLKKMVEQSKMPAYSEMKRKSFIPSQNAQRDSVKSSMRPSLKNSLTGRTILSELNQNSNYDKNDIASTCFNEEQRCLQSQQQINPILKLQKPSRQEEIQRQNLTNQIQYLISKTEIFEKNLEEIKTKQEKQFEKNREKIVKQESQLGRIQEYKKKLLRLLNKLKSREVEMDEMVKIYRKLHEQTIKKLQQSTQALKQLQQENVDEDVQQKYAEVLELQQRLQIIDAQLQQMDEQKWLEKVFKELTVVFRRLGIPIPKCESVRSAIDELCEILIENHLICKQDNVQKLSKLKEYSEEERQNNQRLIQGLKTKEQALSKKLNNLQMQKGSNTNK